MRRTTPLVLFSAMALVISPFFFNQPIETPREVIRKIDQYLQNVPSLPRYMEGGYSPLGRSPVVDVLLADPLYLPIYAETVAELIKELSQKNSLLSLSSSLLTAAGVPITQGRKDQYFRPTSPTPDKFLQTFPQATAQKLYSYWHFFLQIHHEVENILSVLSEDEKNWIKQNNKRFFFEKQDSESDYDFFTTDNPHPLKFFNLASRLDFAKLADAARKLSQIADDFYQFRQEFTNLSLEEDFIWEENHLKLIVSRRSNSTHEEKADFFIDLGGYNTIRNSAGGTGGERSLALHLDLTGHNSYEGQDFVQGCGFLGVGLLASCAGHNTYHADSYAQGCGFFGVGLLVNFEGENNFHLNFGGQSFALFGSSILWNKEGKNLFQANHGMAQAASSTLGVAFLIENQGDNSFNAGISGNGGTTRRGGIGQGGSSGVRADPWLNNPSFYGGLSFLYLGGGNNKLKTVWLGQGSAYFLGVGIIVAEGSHDVFEADYDAQGQGLHLAGGLLLRKGDHGRFQGGWGSLGVSGDRSIGMFINIGSHNIYSGTNQSIGSSRKPKSVGIFVNLGGDNTYIFQKLSNARLQFPQSPKEWSSALFLEVGSGSTYPEYVDEFKRGDGLEWGIKGHSLGVSTQSLGKDSITTLFDKFHKTPQISFAFDPVEGWASNTAYLPLIYNPNEPQEIANEILIANYDRRRQIYEILDLIRFNNRKIEYDLSFLLNPSLSKKDDAFNYGVLWALRNKGRANLSEIMKGLASGNFQSDYSRKMAVSLIGTFWTPEVDPLLIQLMLEDPLEEIRYHAALVLAKHLSPNSMDPIKLGLKSDSEVVRYAIAKGLQESINPSALTIVIPLFNDESFYVRRAAGLTAISLGDKNGVSVVLGTLQHETLDTEENYGDNIYTQLSNYLGLNFGLNREAWINWWKQAEETFQIPIRKDAKDTEK